MLTISLPFHLLNGKGQSDNNSGPNSDYRRRDQPTVIQQEGWLWKRGAGYKPQVQQTFHTGSSAGLGEDAEQPASARRGSGLRATTSLSGIPSFMYGKDEKKRYFMLLTTPAGNKRKQKELSREGPKAELWYFKKRPESQAERANPKGIIILTADMDIVLDENTLLIQAPWRTYYLRHDATEQLSAKARTATAQWMSALKFAVSGLRAYELQEAVGIGALPHPLQDQRALRYSGIMTGLNEERRAARRSFSGDKLPPAGKTNPTTEISLFADLWQAEGIEAYDRIVAHFGPALTDFERLKDHFQSRVTQIDAEISILEDEMGHASDAVVKEQRTVADVLKELHRSSQRHISALREASKDFNSRVIAPINEATHNIGTLLEGIVSKHSIAASYVEGAKRSVLEAIEKVEKLQESLENALEAPKHNDSKSRVLRRKSEGPPPDPAKIEIELNEARQARRDASQTLVTTEAKHAETIFRAMGELHGLEKLRLKSLATILEAASDIEQRLTAKLTNESSGLESCLDQVDAPRDIRSTFAKLKASAEKSRPNRRRKNTLYNLLDFSKLEPVVDQ